jgi:hypothetical protein
MGYVKSLYQAVAFFSFEFITGGICAVTILGRSMIIVNSTAIMDELDKQGAVYSDRPVLQMGGELAGYCNTLVLLRYGSRFRTFRKHFSNTVGPIPLEDHKRTITYETHRFLKQVLANPQADNLMPHLRKYVYP